MSTTARAVCGAVAFLLGAAILGFADALVAGDPIILRAVGFGLMIGSIPFVVRAVLPGG